jgi:hypothetical protein
MINITLWATGTLSQIARIAANNAIAEHQDPEMSVGLDSAVIRMMARDGRVGLVFRGRDWSGEWVVSMGLLFQGGTAESTLGTQDLQSRMNDWRFEKVRYCIRVDFEKLAKTIVTVIGHDMEACREYKVRRTVVR